LSIAKGLTTKFTATGTFSDGTTRDVTGTVTWTSQNTGVATITSSGLARGIGVGTTTIQASTGTINKSVTLQVTAATLVSIAVTGASASISKGMTDQFTATGTFTDGTTQNLTASVTWTSMNTNIAAIGAGGLATGVGAGSTMIQAASGGVNGTANITVIAATLVSIAVTPVNQTIAKGLTQQFTATGTFSDNSTQNLTTSATRTSLNPGFATITAGGLATGVGAGTATIQAAQGGITGATSLTVSGATLVSIAVTPANPSIAPGLTKQFTATGTFTNNSTQNLTNSVTWSSSNTAIATISNAAGTNGLATGIKSGTATVQAQQGPVSGSMMLTVGTVSLAVLVVSPQNPAIADGGATQTFKAIGHFNDGSTQDLAASVTWSSSNTNVAIMSGAVATSQTLAGSATAGFTSIQAMVAGTTGGGDLERNQAGRQRVRGCVYAAQRHCANRTECQRNNIDAGGTSIGIRHGIFCAGGRSHFCSAALCAQRKHRQWQHNVIYVVTEGDSAYAFDADRGAQYWHANMIDTTHGGTGGKVVVDSNNDVGCEDLIPIVGITSTPVIDPSTGIMYVETKSKKTNRTFVHRLHGIDITTGLEKLGTPPDITGTAAGGSITFNALKHLNRPGLLWLNGVVYVAYASHCDSTPYYGWVFAYDAATLGQRAVWNAAPIPGNTGGLGGIWMAGSGLAADSAGNIFLPTGNGVFDTVNIPATQLGDSEVKLFYNGTTTLSLLDYFTPFNQLNLEQGDVDLGSGGILLLPDQPGNHPHELIQAGKDGTIRVIDRDQMTTDNLHYCASNCNNQDAQIVQELFGSINGIWSMPAYWNGDVYFSAKKDNLASYALNGSGMLSTTRNHSSVHGFGYPGATPSVSANGTTNGIVWAIDTTNNGTISGGSPTQLLPAVLYVFDATNLTELYNSSMAAGDAPGNADRCEWQGAHWHGDGVGRLRALVRSALAKFPRTIRRLSDPWEIKKESCELVSVADGGRGFFVVGHICVTARTRAWFAAAGNVM
jgi:Big-like domain-containing protein